MLKMWRSAVMIVLLYRTLGVSGNENVTDLYISHKVVSDVIPVTPEELLNVMYPGNITVKLAGELTPTQVKDEPTVTWNATAEQFYTLIFIDADWVPKNTSDQLQHWVVGNIPDSNISAGETIVEYVGAAPSLGSGLHRYVLLVYLQPSNLTFDEKRVNKTSFEGRAGFSTNDFANKHNLTGPVAGNFFRAKYDSYVPIVYDQVDVTSGASKISGSNLGGRLTIIFLLGCFMELFFKL